MYHLTLLTPLGLGELDYSTTHGTNGEKHRPNQKQPGFVAGIHGEWCVRIATYKNCCTNRARHGDMVIR